MIDLSDDPPVDLTLMPQLGPRERQFVETFLGTADIGGAYAAAYGDIAPLTTQAARVKGRMLLCRKSVNVWIRAAQESFSLQNIVTLDTVLAQLLESYAIARELRQPGLMVQATAMLARVTGLEPPSRIDVRKTEDPAPRGKPDFDAILKRARAQAAEAG